MKTLLTPLTRRLYRKARRAGLSCPLGRALYITNRNYNGDKGRCPYTMVIPDETTRLRRVQVTTANRWLRHWAAGGSLKSLNRSAVMESARRHEDWLRVKAIKDTWRQQ